MKKVIILLLFVLLISILLIFNTKIEKNNEQIEIIQTEGRMN